MLINEIFRSPKAICELTGMPCRFYLKEKDTSSGGDCRNCCIPTFYPKTAINILEVKCPNKPR